MRSLKTSALCLILMVFMTSVGMAQHKVQNFFRGLKNDTDVSAITLGGDMLNGLLKKDSLGLDSEIESVTILIYSKTDMDDAKKSRMAKAITTDKYDLLVSSRDGAMSVNAYGISTEEMITSLAGSITTKEQNFYFFMKGRIRYEEVAKLQLDALPKML